MAALYGSAGPKLYNEGVAVTTTSCPRCGQSTPALASRCGECGFVFFEEPARRSLPRPSPGWLVLVVLLLAGGAALAVLLLRDPEPEPLAPLARTRAEPQLTRELERQGITEVGSVRCAGPIRTAGFTRCQLHYTDGDTQLMLVRRTDRGPLDIMVPYPAQRRPGG